MSLQVRQAVVQGNRLSVTVYDGDSELVTTFDGAVSSSLSIGVANAVSVCFRCVPQSAEKHSKPLNSPPLDF